MIHISTTGSHDCIQRAPLNAPRTRTDGNLKLRSVRLVRAVGPDPVHHRALPRLGRSWCFAHRHLCRRLLCRAAAVGTALGAVWPSPDLPLRVAVLPRSVAFPLFLRAYVHSITDSDSPTGFQVGCALSPNIGSLIVFRFLGGCFAAAPLTNSGGIIADLWGPDRRGDAMALFALMPFGEWRLPLILRKLR